MHLENIFFYAFCSVKFVRTSFQGVRIESNKRCTESKIVLNFITSAIVYWVTTAIWGFCSQKKNFTRIWISLAVTFVINLVG